MTDPGKTLRERAREERHKLVKPDQWLTAKEVDQIAVNTALSILREVREIVDEVDEVAGDALRTRYPEME